MSRWIKVDTDILQHWIWQDPQKAYAWLDLIMLANWKSKKASDGFGVAIVGRGSYLTSQIKLAARWKVSRRWVQMFLLLLENEQMIEQKKSTKNVYITIRNYEKYQATGNNVVAPDEQQKSTKNAAKEQQKSTTIEYLDTIEGSKDPIEAEPPAQSPPKKTRKKSTKIRKLEDAAWSFPPKWDDKARASFARWIEYRAAGTPLLQMTLQALIDKYAETPRLFAEAVDFTIEKGWQGLQEPRTQAPAHSKNTGRKTTAQNLDEALDFMRKEYGYDIDGGADGGTSDDGSGDVFDVTGQ